MPRFIALLIALLAPLPALAQATSTLLPRVKFETSLGNIVVEVDTCAPG
jgi:hypothetical protein